jgi:hypothetical protein
MNISCLPDHWLRRTFRATCGVFAAAALSLSCHASRSAVALAAVDERVIRLHQTWSLASVSLLVEIRQRASGQVSGRMRVTSGQENRGVEERAYACRMTRVADYGSGWACDVPFARGAPDWHALLARLDSLGVNAPPAISPRVPGGLQLICADGIHWVLEVRPAGGGALLRDTDVCGPTDSLRAAFEAGINSVLATVARAGRVY